MSLAVIRKRLAWQKLMPSMPLFCSMTSCGWPAAALAGVDHEQRVRLVQAVLPRQIAGQHHDAVAGVFVRLLDLLVGAVDGVGALDLVLQDLLCHGHRLEEAGVLVLFRVPHGVEEADGVTEAVLLAGIVVQIEGLDEVLINEPGLTLAYKAGAEYPPQQAEGRVRDAVGAGLAGLLMVVEHAKANVVNDAVEVIRHHEAAGYFNIRAEDLEQGSGEHVVSVELACVGKAVCGYFHRDSPHSLMHSVAHSIAHSRAADNKKEPPHDAAAPIFYRKFSQWLACAASNSACVRI